jgi:hypothetical protein
MTLKNTLRQYFSSSCRASTSESLLIPCNGKTIQVTQSSITSMLKKRNLIMAEFSQRKTLLVRDEHSLPDPLILCPGPCATEHQQPDQI